MIRNLIDNLLFLWAYVKYVTGRHDYVSVESDDAKVVYTELSESVVLGEIESDRNPARLYTFGCSEYMASFVPESEESFDYDGLLRYEFASDHWDYSICDEQGDVVHDAVVDTLHITELHELTHWACTGQGFEPESMGPDHSRRWNPVLADAIEDVDGDYNGPV